MILNYVWSVFERDLFSEPSTDELFNPYTGHNDALDVPEAASIRRDNLRRYVSAYETAPPLFLLAEAPGPWGCRFSGVPITAEAQLLDDDFPLSGRRTSQEDEPHTEYSAGIFWRVLQPYFPHFFVWNSVPFHPHDAGEPLTIRTPRRSEVRAWGDHLTSLLDALSPDRIVGIGRKAERALTDVGANVTYVRHPSQGGAKKFEAGVLDILEDVGIEKASA